MNNPAPVTPPSPKVAFPRALLEMRSDPIRELNFKCCGNCWRENAFLGLYRLQQMVGKLEAKALSW